MKDFIIIILLFICVVSCGVLGIQAIGFLKRAPASYNIYMFKDIHGNRKFQVQNSKAEVIAIINLIEEDMQ